MQPDRPVSAARADEWRAALRACLARTEPSHERQNWLVPGLDLEPSRALAKGFPESPRPAAVLIPVVDHSTMLTILLTTRATQLKNHAGQISFPGGSLEPGEPPLAAALREAHEEIGLLPDRVALVGYLPDHVLLTGYRVTPVVGLVQSGFEFAANKTEVHDVFEVPVELVLTESNYVSKVRRIRQELEIQTHSVVFEGREIWGATAGILLNLARRCADAMQ